MKSLLFYLYIFLLLLKTTNTIPKSKTEIKYKVALEDITYGLLGYKIYSLSDLFEVLI